MIIDELNKKIADIESLANDKNSTIESKVSDLTDGILMVADAVDIIPEMVDEKITAITKEFSTIKDSVSKVKAQKGEKGSKGDKGDKGDTGEKGENGKDGSPDTGEQIADKLNELEGVLDPKVLKDFTMPDVKDLERQINTIGNQTLRLLSRPTTNTTSSLTGVTDLNGLTGAVTLSAGNNVTLNESGNDIEINADFTQTGKYMISGGATWSGTGLTYDVSFLNYFFNGNKTANPTQVTLTASDPTDNRFDAIVVDEVGTVTAITGTASANPEVPAIPEDQLQVTIILVAAGSTTPTIASEEIYMDDPTTNWTFSTYTTGTATGSINFAGTSSPKQGTECIEASTDARLGARFVRDTSFDAFQYTLLQLWVRFTGTAVASNKSLNVRFENSAGTLVGSTVNLFSYGLQRGVLNTWQLVVVPITAFGALPATVKGLKVIMAGGTVGVARQWDLDYMILTNGSVPFANVPTIAFYKNGTGIASQPGINLIEGTGVTITGTNNPTNNRVDYTINAAGGSPGGSDLQVQFNDGGSFGGDQWFTFDKTTGSFRAGDIFNKIYLDTAAGEAGFYTQSSGLGFIIGTIATGAKGFLADSIANVYQVGNESGTKIVVDDTTQLITLSSNGTDSITTSSSSTLIQGNTSSQRILFDVNGTPTYRMGSSLSNDIGSHYQMELLSGTNLIWRISNGDENSGTSFFNIYDTAGANDPDITVGNIFGMRIFGNGTDTTTIGANNGAGNDTRIEVNDLVQLVTITNVPSYADDATATGAGLTTGQLYKTTTLGSTYLKIVP